MFGSGENSLPFPFSALTRYVHALFTVWKDELGLGRLIEATGVPITTAAGASLSWFTQLTVAIVRWALIFSNFQAKSHFWWETRTVFLKKDEWFFVSYTRPMAQEFIQYWCFLTEKTGRAGSRWCSQTLLAISVCIRCAELVVENKAACGYWTVFAVSTASFDLRTSSCPHRTLPASLRPLAWTAWVATVSCVFRVCFPVSYRFTPPYIHISFFPILLSNFHFLTLFSILRLFD